jgi:serine/threonine protein kinase
VEHVEKILGLHGITIAPPTPSDGSTAAEAAEAADSHNPELIEEEKDNADAGSVTLDLGKEVNLLMRLDHPNIIRLYNVIETEHEYYIVMYVFDDCQRGKTMPMQHDPPSVLRRRNTDERKSAGFPGRELTLPLLPFFTSAYKSFQNNREYASGGEMIDYLVTRKRLSEIEARKFFRQLVSALDHCHSAHVVHRDLKLENLLLSADKNLLISDFGLGRTFRPVGEDYLSTFCGTPLYASPELVSGIKYIGPPADCWSAGVVLYALAAGKPPFQGDGISELYKNIKSVHYTVPDYFSPGKVFFPLFFFSPSLSLPSPLS